MARDFTGGSSDRVDIGTFSIVSNFITLSAWVWWDAINGSRDDRLISKANGTAVASHDWMLGITGGGGVPKLRCRMNRQDTTLVATTTITTGAWHHALVTYDGSVNPPFSTIYLNGAQDGQANWPTGTQGNLPNNTDAVYIGNQPTATTNAPDGRIAWACAWNVVLNANEIAALARGVNPLLMRPDALQFCLPLDGFDTPERDYTRNARTGTVTGTSRANGAPVMPWVRSNSIWIPAAGGTDRRAQFSWAELESPIAPRRMLVSFGEMEAPFAPRRANLSWVELETPLGPRRANVSYAELETPLGPRRALFSWAELEAPSGPRRAVVSWAEVEAPFQSRRAHVTWSELEAPLAPRRTILTWAEMEAPDAPSTQRRAVITWGEIEAPLAPRRARVVWAEIETPLGPRRVQISWAETSAPFNQIYQAVATAIIIQASAVTIVGMSDSPAGLSTSKFLHGIGIYE